VALEQPDRLALEQLPGFDLAALTETGHVVDSIKLLVTTT
jgi:hypothetical protein